MIARISPRDRNEIVRSARDASKIGIKPVDVERYLDPPATTPFPLEYAFHLLGNVRGMRVLDLGCGSGEKMIPLLHRGASVTGIDISPDLIALAECRLNQAGLSALVRVASAYQTELPAASVDIIFCMSLIHHLDIPRVREEMRRILRPDGFIILKEPIRFSRTYGFLRSLLPTYENISAYEHPLTEQELLDMQGAFDADGLRFFRLPVVPLVQRTVPVLERRACLLSNWTLARFPKTTRFATVAVLRLRKSDAA